MNTDVLGEARRDTLARTGQLQAMRDVEHNRIPELTQHGKCSHVHHEVVVAEADAALGDQHCAVAFPGDFRDDMPHVVRREELPLLHVHGLPCACRRDEQIGLPRQKCGDLQDVNHGGRRGRVRGLVNIGQDGEPRTGPDLAKRGQSRVKAGAAERRTGCAVRLVVGGLEDDRDGATCRDLLDRRGGFERVVATFDDAGTENKGERVAAADRDRTCLDRVRGSIL
jgi:hypothetical protein